ncbi:MAG: hypothetical protein ACM3UU_12095 [Ignavibacteriales bacterium]
MKKVRAIFIGDVRFDECPVFELNEQNGYFEMLKDKDFRYEKQYVIEDKDFITFVIENDVARVTKTL